MQKLAQTILDRIAAWPKEAQAELLQSMIDIEERHVGVYRLSSNERASVQRGLDEMRNGQFASEERIAAIFNRHRE